MALTPHYFSVICTFFFSLSTLAQTFGAFNASSAPAVPQWPWQTWGPYRPNLYFGIRPQIPETVLIGLMWASGESRGEMLSTLRDTCEQNDGMAGYGWDFYDARTGGSQVVHDTQLQLDLSTSFTKSDDGNSWAVRITGTPKSNSADIKTALIIHLGVERQDKDGTKALACDNTSAVKNGIEAVCRGSVAALGDFEFQIRGDAKNSATQDTAVRSIQVPEEKIWQAKSVFTEQIRAISGSKLTIEDAPGAGNLHFVQLVFQGQFEATLTYHAAAASVVDANGLDISINSLHDALAERVDAVFPLASPFRSNGYGLFARQMLSNLLGGLGFFHGDTKVDDSHSPEYEETDTEFWTKATAAMSRAPVTITAPKTLLSFTPSRPFFPRGFLWDEGFHLLPVIEWDLDLAISVLNSWLNLVDSDGWIGREQILGPEARSRVPPEFQVQYPHYANPPTLSLLLPVIISKLTGASPYAGHPSAYLSSTDTARAMVETLYPLLARHYNWFRRTQAGNFTAYPRPDTAVPGVGFRWRGRTPKHTLTSGLDDYPRANPPHPGELHVDALAWVGASASALQQVARYLGEAGDAETYARHVEEVKHNLDVLHWDAAQQVYCDATVQDGDHALVCHEGYISIMPLLLGLMGADHPHVEALFDLMADPEKLWSPHGLRSLSKAEEGYGKDEDYWRGAVWMNLNVLAVLRLRDIDMSGEGPAAVRERALTLGGELRKNVVQTVHDSWAKTGFFWEQYSDVTGDGRRSRAFTGWTATVLLLLGLDFGGIEKEVANEARISNGWILLVGALGVPLSVLVFVPGLRRRVLVALAGVVNSWATWKSSRRMGGRYEQVIDLDEREP